MTYEYHFLDEVDPDNLQNVLNNQGQAGFKLMTAQLIQIVTPSLSGPKMKISYHLIFEKQVLNA